MDASAKSIALKNSIREEKINLRNFLFLIHLLAAHKSLSIKTQKTYSNFFSSFGRSVINIYGHVIRENRPPLFVKFQND